VPKVNDTTKVENSLNLVTLFAGKDNERISCRNSSFSSVGKKGKNKESKKRLCFPPKKTEKIERSPSIFKTHLERTFVCI
jgi:hypothetical protein